MAKGATHHSAKTGQFVSPKFAASHPRTTIRVTTGAKPSSAPRDAGTGQFVTDGYAVKRPSTTVDGK